MTDPAPVIPISPDVTVAVPAEPATAQPAAPVAAGAEPAERLEVLVAVDETEASVDAVHTAYRVFGDRARYTVVTIGRPPLPVMPVSPLGVEAPMLELYSMHSERSEVEQEAADTARLAAEELDAGSAGADVEVAVEVGEPGRRICELAASRNSDVIVIGSHDRSIFDRLLRPSVGSFIVRHAPCSVLVVR